MAGGHRRPDIQIIPKSNEHDPHHIMRMLQLLLMNPEISMVYDNVCSCSSCLYKGRPEMHGGGNDRGPLARIDGVLKERSIYLIQLNIETIVIIIKIYIFESQL